jgi:hypothetical protein
MSEEEDEESSDDVDVEPAFVTAAARPGRAEITEEPAFVPLPRDYAADFGNGTRPPAITEEPLPPPSVSPLSAASGEEERDLDVPTFMRRMKF